MHSTNLYPAGVGVELDTVDAAQWIKAEVVEPTAKLLVQKGVLRAFSVGISRPKIVRDNRARGGRVVDGIFSEVSLVDRPANSNCKFTMCKRFGEDGDNPTIQLINKLEVDKDFLAKFASGELDVLLKGANNPDDQSGQDDGDGKDDGKDKDSGGKNDDAKDDSKDDDNSKDDGGGDDKDSDGDKDQGDEKNDNDAKDDDSKDDDE